MTTRKITTTYEALEPTNVLFAGHAVLSANRYVERSVTVEVEQEDRFTARVCDDLDDLGVPADEQAGVRDHAIEAFWAAERSAYPRGNPDAE